MSMPKHIGKLTRIHVNQHNIKHNRAAELANLAGKVMGGDDDRYQSRPVLTVKDYRENRKGNQADITINGVVVASVVYRPDDPLPCGAHCWIETRHEVEVK